MALADMAPLERKLTMTNLAERSESCYFVKQINCVGKILDDADDDAETRFKTLSEADQQVLNWQTSPDSLQSDDDVFNTLMQESGRLCPCKSYSFAFFSKVQSDDNSLQHKLGEHPLSAYEQISFRTAMLTKHSAVDGRHPELLAQHDGLGCERSFMRWRSNEYGRVTLCKPRDCYLVFWLIQWDIVGKLRCAVAPEPEPAERPPARIRPPLGRPHPISQFHNIIRFDKRRKPRPWIAEVRLKGERRKNWLGSYRTKEAAACAADVANRYYDRGDLLNFKDSLTNLEPVPLVLSEKGRMMFVQKEAKRIARLSETQPSVLPHNLTSCIQSSDDARNSTAGNMQQPEALEVRAAFDHVQVITGNGGDFFPETVLLPENLTPCTTCTEFSIDGCNSALGNVMQQPEALEVTAASGHLKVFTGYGGDVVFPETGGSSLEENQNVWPSTPPDSSFVSALSPGSPPLIGQAHMYPNSFSPESFNIACQGGRFVGMDITEFDEDNGDWEDVGEGLFNHWSFGPGSQ